MGEHLCPTLNTNNQIDRKNIARLLGNKIKSLTIKKIRILIYQTWPVDIYPGSQRFLFAVELLN
jgi:hypothetical protein